VRRAAVVVASGAVAVGLLVVLVLVLGGRDKAPVQTVQGPGEAFRDQCAAHERTDPSTYNSDPPTNGPHLPRLPAREQLSGDDELLHALELGDVVILYPQRTPPATLRRLQDDLSGPFDRDVAAAGQAVILSRDPSVGQITGLAWRHRLRATGAGEPAIREFADFWLGKGYAEARGENCPPAG
jgi:uncharacterized protein DUF3105